MSGLTSEKLRVPKTIKLYIDGKFPRTESGRSLPAYAHDSERVYAHICWASRKDLRNSVEAAKKAQAGWEGKSAYNRAQILYRMAEMTEGKRPEFIEILCETLGYTTDQAERAVDEAIDSFVYYAGFADKYQQVIGAVNPVSGPHHCFTTPEAVGVVGLICEEEFNFGRLTAQISAIISSGNTLVALLAEKGSPVLAPLAEVFATSDLPNGVINLLTGKLSELASHFGSHMELHSISCQRKDPKLLAELKKQAIANMKRMIEPSGKPHSLEQILQFVEFKTVWHPVGC